MLKTRPGQLPDCPQILTPLQLVLGHKAQTANVSLGVTGTGARAAAELTERNGVWVVRVPAHSAPVSFAVGLHEGAALAKLTKMVSHYTYSRENREALAEANKVLSEYQPAVEPPTDE
jgi:hypothetical protein